MASIVTGPNDGASLYREGKTPCLHCGLIVDLTSEGAVAWHIRAGGPATCRGSGKTWEI